ncbi:MAG: hypothetical protein ACRDWS_14500 [Acidimicrobiia bacterium]
MPRLTGLSFAHPAVAADRRAPLCLTDVSLSDARSRLRSDGHDAFLLSTCMRVEIVWEGGLEKTTDVLTGLYGDDSMSDLGVRRVDGDLFLHLCRVAAGLDSPMVGEREVLGQFRRAVAVYQESPRGLGRALEAAVGIGRAIRRHLGESTKGSLGAVAAGAVTAHERVAVLGAGTMARAAVQVLPEAGVTVFARRPGQVAGHEARPWDEAVEALATFPVVMSTVPGESPLFPEEVVGRLLASRANPLFLIDLGMPPGFDGHSDHPLVRYMGIDEVASSVVGQTSLEVEQMMVSEAASAWVRLAAPDRVGSVIAAMVGQADRAVDEEVRRFAGRLSGAQDPEPILRQLAHTVARRVLHPPISYVGSTEPGSEAVEVIADAFGVVDE